MPKQYRQRVGDYTTTTGTGTITLAGTSLLGIAANGDVINLLIEDGEGEYELVQGTVLISSANVVTFSRDTIIASSQDGGTVSFAAGAKTVSSFPISLENNLMMEMKAIRKGIELLLDQGNGVEVDLLQLAQS